MRKISMPTKDRNCPHCGERNGLSYYREESHSDTYYCENCFGIVLWNGEEIEKIQGEAYPNRDKLR